MYVSSQSWGKASLRISSFITGQYTEFSSMLLHLILVFPITYQNFFYLRRFKHQVELKYFLSDSLIF